MIYIYYYATIILVCMFYFTISAISCKLSHFMVAKSRDAL